MADPMSAATTPRALPRHIAIIMDGNGRWAKGRSLPRPLGHHAGMRAVREVIEDRAEAVAQPRDQLFEINHGRQP